MAFSVPIPSMFPWEVAYLNAVLEADNSLLADHIKVAEESIERRIVEASQASGDRGGKGTGRARSGKSCGATARATQAACASRLILAIARVIASKRPSR